jgi:hypothetical protein
LLSNRPDQNMNIDIDTYTHLLCDESVLVLYGMSEHCLCIILLKVKSTDSCTFDYFVVELKA